MANVMKVMMLIPKVIFKFSLQSIVNISSGLCNSLVWEGQPARCRTHHTTSAPHCTFSAMGTKETPIGTASTTSLLPIYNHLAGFQQKIGEYNTSLRMLKLSQSIVNIILNQIRGGGEYCTLIVCSKCHSTAYTASSIVNFLFSSSLPNHSLRFKVKKIGN